jgi:hypothetical protein
MQTMVTRASLALLLLLGVVAPIPAQEKLTLSTPVAQASVTDYQVDYIGISRASWTLVVQLHPSNAAVGVVTCSWGAQTNNKGLTCTNGYVNANAPSGFATVQAMIIALNKANLSTGGNSLEARIYSQLVADGAFVGSVTGTPQ